jgi:hypothetical protein
MSGGVQLQYPITVCRQKFNRLRASLLSVQRVPLHSIMAPKAKKAKAPKVAKALVQLASSSSSSTAVVASEPGPHAREHQDLNQHEQKKRRLNRRTSDEQVERALQARTSHIPLSVWETRRDKAGRTVRQVVKDALKSVRSGDVRGRLSTKFWTSLHETFELNETLADNLAEPPLDQDVNPELLEVLQVACKSRWECVCLGGCLVIATAINNMSAVGGVCRSYSIQCAA